MGISEADKLDLNITATVQFAFGTICDKVQTVLGSNDFIAGKISWIVFSDDEMPFTRAQLEDKVRAILDEKSTNNIQVLQRETRNQGNNAIRIVQNHLQHYRILRRHKRDKINVERVTEKHRKRDQDGDSTIPGETESS